MKIMRISICLLICMVFVFTGCQQKKTNSTDDTTQNMYKEPPEYDLYIEVHSEQELSQMREMIGNSDEKALEEYLKTSPNGAKSREDIENFVKLVDTVPYVSLIEGELTWACHKIGESIDTGKPYNILSIATTADNGEWVRIEYHLHSLESADALTNELKETDASAVLARPVQSKDKKVTVYTEIRRVQTAGKSIWWTADIDGIFARIIYSTENMDAVKTESVFSNCTVTGFADR